MSATDSYLQTPEHFTSKLVRNHDMVHVRTCARVKDVKVNPWLWADTQPRAEIASARENGIKFCRSCDPLLWLLKH
ncbi:hypothetical protein [Curtobacterium sp. Arg-1]|uniref:hypothetical protein n=1 Tax=Curtobacterium sp. Arg-1 TaxID=2935040 RepID=UPI0021DA727C|nr:hypothetical protein [Curtobacterium sp. Arg-1]UXZ57045.1 hypothetical protein MXD64_13705 [Curtobacterium sp. Arg-1]